MDFEKNEIRNYLIAKRDTVRAEPCMTTSNLRAELLEEIAQDLLGESLDDAANAMRDVKSGP